MSSPTETFQTSPPGGLFSRYAPLPGVYDETLEADGRLRAPWQDFARRLDELGAAGLNQRDEQVRLLLRENGTSYNVHGAPEGPNRPWELDPIPLLLVKHEWDCLTAGLEQRVRLFNAVLADLCGAQRLVHGGLIPAALVFGYPGFPLPCHGITPAQNLYVHLYASHLARRADGRWLVLADRTQGPAGAGFALENRIITSRILPHDYDGLYVERLAPFFISLRDMLHGLAPQHRGNPRVVLLSPGPASSTYFEDTYLARYLGYTLVEAGDLTVRRTCVYLKTLGGLLPVDIVLRRVADEDCDPLEFQGASLQGVPGLVEAWRSGQVVIANGLGSGFLESPALAAFLPGICRQLLGEDLRLESVPTWWCGRDADWSYVQEHFDELVIKAAVAYRAPPPILTWQLSPAQRAELHATIACRRGEFVAQARVVRSTAPVWHNGALHPWYVGVKTFAVATRDGAFQVMPGGLSRVASHADALGESMAAGQRSKDVWVLSDRPVAAVTLLRPPAAAVELRRSGNDLPSRVADNLYWLGRHIERAEGMVRQVRSALVRMTSEVAPANLRELILLVQALTEESALPPLHDAEAGYVRERLQAEITSFLFDEARGSDFAATVRALYRTAAIARDRISVDTWRIVNQLDLEFLSAGPRQALRPGEVLHLLNQVLNLLVALSGLGGESMTRGPGWRFMDMGRRLERALHTLTLLRRTLVRTPAEVTPLLEALLEIADSSMTYRYRYLTSLQLAPVLDLLLIDETNPRSVGFQLSVLAEHVRQLPLHPHDRQRNEELRITTAARAVLRIADVEGLSELAERGVRPRLDAFLEQLTLQLWQLSSSISHTYFTHTGPSRQLGSPAADSGT